MGIVTVPVVTLSEMNITDFSTYFLLFINTF